MLTVSLTIKYPFFMTPLMMMTMMIEFIGGDNDDDDDADTLAVAAVHVFLRLFTTGQPRVIAVGVSSRYILIIIRRIFCINDHHRMILFR